MCNVEADIPLITEPVWPHDGEITIYEVHNCHGDLSKCCEWYEAAYRTAAPHGLNVAACWK